MADKDTIVLQWAKRWLDAHSAERSLMPNAVRAYAGDISKFVDFMGDRSITDVNPQTMEEYFSHLKEIGYATGSLRRFMGTVRCFFTFLIETNVLFENPTDNIKYGPYLKPARKTYSDWDFRLLLSGISGTEIGLRDRAMLALAREAEAGAPEITQALLPEMSLESAQIILRTKKTSRAVHLRDSLEPIKDYLSRSRSSFPKTESPYLFLCMRGGPMLATSYWKMLKDHAARAGLPHVSPKTLARRIDDGQST